LRRVAEIIALAESLDADRLELANSQYVGWALLNRAVLLPTREQLDEARRRARAPQGPNGSAVRHPGLLRGVSQGLHGRLGEALHPHLAGRPRAALSRGA